MRDVGETATSTYPRGSDCPNRGLRAQIIFPARPMGPETLILGQLDTLLGYF